MRGTVPAELPRPETVDPGELARAFAAGGLDLVCALGPTASGKTRYAVNLARAMSAPGMPAEIISADSRQVYRGMDIGTGKDLSEYGEVPYHLIDILPAGEHYNVYSYCEDFARAYSGIRSRGAIPILCGGTGLYINAVTTGYDFRTSKPLSAPGAGPSLRTYYIGTLVSREERNARIDARLTARLQEGLVEEVRGLLDSGVPAATLKAYGLEYKFVTQYVLGEIGYDGMFTLLSTAIHQFAKRQMTWFRGMERAGTVIHWVEV